VFLMTLHYRAALLLALCSASASASAQPAQPRRMSFDDVLAMKAVGDAQVSPDGRWVAYTVTRADLELNASDSDVWLVAATGGTPVRLTTSRKVTARRAGPPTAAASRSSRRARNGRSSMPSRHSGVRRTA